MSPTPPESQSMLLDTLEIAVPIWIDRLQRVPWSWINERRHDALITVDEHTILSSLPSATGAITAPEFAALAEALAILAFFPGGVSFCGRRWSAIHPEFTSSQTEI